LFYVYLAMKYGIVVCSKCKRAKGFLLNNKTTRCIVCGKVLNIKKLKIMFKTDSRVKMRNAIGIINADIDGNSEIFQKFIAKQ